jgi:hypothetical protein
MSAKAAKQAHKLVQLGQAKLPKQGKLPLLGPRRPRTSPIAGFRFTSLSLRMIFAGPTACKHNLEPATRQAAPGHILPFSRFPRFCGGTVAAVSIHRNTA